MGYDLQTGSNEKKFNYNDLMKKRIKILIEHIKKVLLKKKKCNIIEIGIGEGNTMRHLIGNLDKNLIKNINFFGVELSFSRIKICKKHIPYCNLIVSDMKHLPFNNNCFDIVYTSSAIEPNLNEEEVILKELYRITSGNLILFEISYKEANKKLKERFNKHKYVKFIYETINLLNYNLKNYEKLTNNDKYNNYYFNIIKNKEHNKLNLISPILQDSLIIVKYNNSKYYKSENLNLYYQIIDDIPILIHKNSILIK